MTSTPTWIPKAHRALFLTLLAVAGCTRDDTDAASQRLLVNRDTDQITLEDTRTVEWGNNSFVLNFYRNKAYTCGLSGDYTFMIVEPANTPGVEAPLWVYQHGGGYGWFDENQVYQTVKTITMDTWNHEETFDDFIDKHLLYNTVDENGVVMNSTLTRRIQEGYRVVFASLCDHDNYSGPGTPYPNNPNPNGGERQVNGLQASMAMVDYTVAYYPDMPSKFGELLLRMPELQRVCQVSLKMFLGGRYFNGASSKKP